MLKNPYVKIENGVIAGAPLDLPETLPHPEHPGNQIGIRHLNDEQLFKLFSLKRVQPPKKPLRRWQRAVGVNAEMINGEPVLVYRTRLLKLAEAKSQLLQRDKTLLKSRA